MIKPFQPSPDELEKVIQQMVNDTLEEEVDRQAMREFLTERFDLETPFNAEDWVSFKYGIKLTLDDLGLKWKRAWIDEHWLEVDLRHDMPNSPLISLSRLRHS